MDHTENGGCMDGLMQAWTPAIDSSVEGSFNVWTPTVSLSVAKTHFLPDDANRNSLPRGVDHSIDNLVGEHTCSLCRSTFATLRGLRVHDHRKHSVDFHTALAVGHRTGNKLRCSLQEKVLVAHEEIRLKHQSQGLPEIVSPLVFSLALVNGASLTK